MEHEVNPQEIFEPVDPALASDSELVDNHDLDEGNKGSKKHGKILES